MTPWQRVAVGSLARRRFPPTARRPSTTRSVASSSHLGGRRFFLSRSAFAIKRSRIVPAKSVNALAAASLESVSENGGKSLLRRGGPLACFLNRVMRMPACPALPYKNDSTKLSVVSPISQASTVTRPTLPPFLSTAKSALHEVAMPWSRTLLLNFGNWHSTISFLHCSFVNIATL